MNDFEEALEVIRKAIALIELGLPHSAYSELCEFSLQYEVPKGDCCG